MEFEEGVCLERNNELVVISEVGVSTNLDEKDVSIGFISKLINGDNSVFYRRSLITCDKLETLGFRRDQSSSKYILDFQGEKICVLFKTELFNDTGLIFQFEKQNGELISCEYIDEIQYLYKSEKGRLLTLAIKKVVFKFVIVIKESIQCMSVKEILSPETIEGEAKNGMYVTIENNIDDLKDGEYFATLYRYHYNNGEVKKMETSMPIVGFEIKNGIYKLTTKKIPSAF